MRTKLVLNLAEPTSGYWDGGNKSRFEFEIWREPKEDKKGKFVRIECFSMNYWFHVALGKTEKQTWGYVKRHMTPRLKKWNKPYTWEVTSIN